MKKDAMSLTKWAFIGIFIGAILFLTLGELLLPAEINETYESGVFTTGWEQVLEDGSRVPVTVPGEVDAESGERIVIEAALPDDLTMYEWICVRSSQQDMNIYIDGELRQSYTTKDSRPFGKTSVSAYVFVELTQADAGKTIAIESQSTSTYSGILNAVYYGDRMSIWMRIIKETGATLILAFSLMIFAVICVVFSGIVSVRYHKDNALGYLGAGIFLTATWIVSESRLRQLFFPNSSVIASMAFIALMLLPFPFIFYINEVQKKRYQKAYVILNFVMLLNFIACIVLQVMNRKDLLESMPMMLVMLVITILMFIWTVWMDYRKGYWKEYRVVAIGFLGLALSGIAEIILVYIKRSILSGISLSIGLLFLLVMALVKTGQDVLAVEKKREEAMNASATKTSFLTNMSHEIRTPISSVMGMNEMILRENKDPQIQEYASNIQSASRVLLGLVNDILDFSKMESGKLHIQESEYELSNLLRDIIRDLENRASQKKLEVFLHISEDLPTSLWGDEIRLRQVLLNLVSNAVKFTKEGSITLSVQGNWDDSENFMLKMSVADTGIGIHKEDISKLFSDFKGIDEYKFVAAQGNGIGLNIAKHLVDRMQGEFYVQSYYEKGSLFTVTVPQKILDKTPIGKWENVYKEEGRKVYRETFYAPDAKILIVDDNAMNLQVAKGLLKKTQVQIDTAANGAECLEKCKEKEYDLILMDHMMPEPDGIETLHLLRKEKENANAKIPVIVLTANAVYGVKELYLSEGFEDYLAKPVVPENLEKMLKKYLPEELIVAEQVEEGNETLVQAENQVSSEVAKNSQKAEPDVAEANETAQPAVDEINQTKGMTYCANDKQMYYELLQMYCEQGIGNIEKLEKFYEEKDWKNFSVLTHAIKSTSLGIGAEVFSELAKQQEFAGKENREDFILESRESFMEAYVTVQRKIRSILEEAGVLQVKETVQESETVDSKADKQQEASENYKESESTTAGLSLEEIIAEYEQMLEKIQNFEMNEVLKQIEELSKKVCEEEKQVLDRIRIAVDNFDYDTAEKNLSDLLAALYAKRGE